MFRATFLGHQGWLVGTERTNVLIDPLLTNGFGHGGLVGNAYPPRRVDAGAIPPIDAVVVTHEHDDHFDLPTLAKLDRRIPIYLSVRSSFAAQDVLAGLGFETRALEPSQRISIGDLRYQVLVTEHRDGHGGDEWDVLPFVISDAAGDGSFFSSVDVRPDQRALEQLASAEGPPGIWCVANNTTAPVFGAGGGSDDTQAVANVLSRRHETVALAWGTPSCTAVVGTGWSYPEPRSWMNRRAFSVDLERVAEALGERHPEAPALAMKPGQTITLRGGRVTGTEDTSPFMVPSPREDWPMRTPLPGGPGGRDPMPCTSPRLLGEEELDQLILRLGDFAKFSYARSAFRGLHSAASTRVDGRLVGLCFDLRQGEDSARTVVAYEPRGCRFEVVGEGSADDYISGYECWASDLLAFLVGDIGPSALCNAGRLRVWNHAPKSVRVSPHDLWMFGHPLRRPEAHTRLYAKIVDELPLVPPLIPGASAPS